MRGIRRREGTDLHQSLALERDDGPLRRRRNRDLAHGPRPVGDLCQYLLLAGCEFGGRGRGCGAKGPQYEPPVQRAPLGIGKIGLKHRDDFRIARSQQRNGRHALRPHIKLAVEPGHDFAVTTEADSLDVDGLDHGAPATHFSTFRAHPWPATSKNTKIRRGAAHVGHDEIAASRKPRSANETRGGTREHRFDRPHRHLLGQRQRAIALHHHQRTLDVERRHGFSHRLDQRRNARDETGIENGGQRPAWRVERRCQFRRQRNRFSR